MAAENMRDRFHYLRTLDGQGTGPSFARRRAGSIANGLELVGTPNIEEQRVVPDDGKDASDTPFPDDDFEPEPDSFDTFDDALDAAIEGEFGSFFGE